MIANPVLRLLLLAVGWLAVALGMLGVVLPLLPTTPFFLLAAGCFARSLAARRRWLLSLPVFGPAVADTRPGAGGAVDPPARHRPGLGRHWCQRAVVCQGLALRGMLLLIALAVSLFLLSYVGRGKARSRPGRRAGRAGRAGGR